MAGGPIWLTGFNLQTDIYCWIKLDGETDYTVATDGTDPINFGQMDSSSQGQTGQGNFYLKLSSSSTSLTPITNYKITACTAQYATYTIIDNTTLYLEQQNVGASITLTLTEVTATNNIKLGANSISKLMLGSTEISAVYFGSTKMFDKGKTLNFVAENALVAYTTTAGQASTSTAITANNVLSVDSVAYTHTQNRYCRLLNAEGEIIQSSLTLPYIPTADNYKVVAHSERSGQCIDYYTQVTMADGTTKNLGDIEVGDMVLSIDFDTMKLVDRKVIYSGRNEPDYDQWITNYYIRNEYSDGTVIKQSMRHRMYNLENKAYVHLDDVWQKGQHTYKQDGTNPALVKRVFVEEPQHYARITLEGCNNYFANGLSTGDSECPTGIVLDHLITR